MPSYDWVNFTPRVSPPADPAANEIYYDDTENALYLCPDGTGQGGGAHADLRLVPQTAEPTAARGRVYYKAVDYHLYVCTAV